MTILYDPTIRKDSTTNGVASPQFATEQELCLMYFDKWSEQHQIDFVEHLLSRMCHYQHGHIDTYLKPMLQRDFISLLPSTYYILNLCKTVVVIKRKKYNVLEKGLDHVAENILSYLDADSLYAAELVCKEWYRVISEGMLWKKLIERKVRTDSLWRGLAERRGW